MPQSDSDRLRAAAERARAGRPTGRRRVATRAEVDAARARITLPSQRRRAEAQSAAEDGGGGSLFGNLAGIKDVVASAPSGLAQLGAEAWDSTVGNLGAITARRVIGDDVDRVRDDFSVFGRAFINENTMEALGDYEEGRGSGGDAVFAATPLPRSLGQSLSDTGGRITQQTAALAPGGLAAGDGEYGRAFSENRLLPLLIEDVGNAAIVGSTVAKPLAAGGRAAARATGSPTVARVAAKTGDIADMSRGIDDAIGKAMFRAPLAIPNRAVGKATGRTIGERFGSAGSRIADTDRYRRFRESPVVRKALDETFISPRSRDLGRQLGDDRMRAAFDSEVVANALRDVVRITGDQPGLGIAAMLDLAQVNRLLPRLDTLDEATFSRLVGSDGALRTLGEAFDEGAIRTGIKVASRYLHDPESLAPDAVAKIEAASGVWGDRVLPLLEERYLDQIGRRDEVAPETVRMLAGDDLLPFDANRVMSDIGTKLGESHPKVVAALDEAREKVTSAPAKYRTAIVFAREMDTALDDILKATDDLAPGMAENLQRIKAEIVTSTVAALDTLKSPGFLMGGRIDRDGPNLRNVRAAPATKSSGEHTKKGVLGPVAPADQAMTIVRDFHRGASTESAKWLAGNLGTRAADLVPDFFENRQNASGKAIAKAVNDVAETPLVAWDIRRWATDEGGNVPINEITADTVFVPEWAVDAFGTATAKVSDAERLMRDYFDRPTRWWKNGVLALSPTWHAGNTIGNVLMAWGGGVNPARQLELLGEAKAMIGRAEQGVLLDGDAPRRMYGSGQSFDAANTLAFARASESGTPTKSELAQFRGPSALQRRLMSKELEPSTRRAKVRNAVAQPIRSSYALNGFVDDLTHGLIYLDRTKKGASPDRALRDSLKVAGDFTNLSRIERQWVRRAIPFWSWMRHITALSADLAVNHPLRTAWTLNLWTLANDDEADTFADIPFLAGAIPVGPTSFLRTQPIFPFGAAMDVTEGGATDPVGMLGGASNPFLKLALEGTTGLEFGANGLQPLSRPYGSATTDAYGNDKLGPIGWGPFGARVSRLLPQLRGARELVREKQDRVVRYDTGQPVTIDGAQLPEQNRRDAAEIVARDILRLPILPPLEADPEAIRARRDR